MINRTRPDANMKREDMQGLDDTIRPIIERDATIQLRGGHPQLARAVDPHGVDPEQAVVLDEGCARAVGGDLLDGQPVRVGAVDVALRVDGRAARRGRQRERLDVRAEDRVRVQRRVVQCQIQPPALNP